MCEGLYSQSILYITYRITEWPGLEGTSGGQPVQVVATSAYKHTLGPLQLQQDVPNTHLSSPPLQKQAGKKSQRAARAGSTRRGRVAASKAGRQRAPGIIPGAGQPPAEEAAPAGGDPGGSRAGTCRAVAPGEAAAQRLPAEAVRDAPCPGLQEQQEEQEQRAAAQDAERPPHGAPLPALPAPPPRI